MPAHDLISLAFPTLDDELLAHLGKCTKSLPRRYHDGQALSPAGDSYGKFFVVVSGKIEIVGETGCEPKSVTIHGPGQFAGDVSQVTGRRAVVSGYARGDTDVYEVSRDALREIMN